jgi:hypothetical protein
MKLLATTVMSLALLASACAHANQARAASGSEAPAVASRVPAAAQECKREIGATGPTTGGAVAQGPTPGKGADNEGQQPITLEKMGSFFFAGTVITDSRGDTFHGDHGYAQFFIPRCAREFTLVMWHGIGQSAKTWESTPDGREGY